MQELSNPSTEPIPDYVPHEEKESFSGRRTEALTIDRHLAEKT